MIHRELIITLAARHRLPAVYALPVFVRDGGLIYYGSDSVDPYRRAAGYVDRILKGEKPADMPVQAPIKYELVINLKTAKALGLTIPPSLLVAADMKRREFIALIGAAAAWPLAARAQQTAMPVIGFFHLTSLELSRENLAAFHRGLGDTGYIEGRNVAIEYRWAQGQNDRLPTLVAELVRRQVSVIVILESTHGALAAKAATQTIPIVCMQAADPVRIGLVDSLNRPGGNITGINLMLAELAGKRLELLLELVPAATSIAYLRNPTNPVFAESETREVQAAARTHAVRLLFVNAGHPSEFETAFADLVQQRADAVMVSSAVSLLTDPDQVVALAARHAVPAIYALRQSMAVGGLMSYGTNYLDAWRQAGVYTGRILRGEKPADLPVVQPTKFELVINLKAAKALGLTVPLTLQIAADKVIE